MSDLRKDAGMSEEQFGEDRYGHCSVCCTPFQQCNRILDGHLDQVYGRSEWPMLCGGRSQR